MKRNIWMFLVGLLAVSFFSLPLKVSADAAPGDVIVTLGEDLTNEQKKQILNEMGVPEDIQPVYVSNKEEH